MKDPASFVMLERSIGFEFMLKNPFSIDDVGIGWRRDKITSIVREKCLKLVDHGSVPLRIFECAKNSFGNGRNGGGGVELEFFPGTKF